MPFATATASARPLRSPAVASFSEKGEADRARARRFRKGLADFAGQEKAYVQGQYRWVARQHARAQSALKKAIEGLKAEWQEEPATGDDSDLWKGYREGDALDSAKTSDDKTK